MPLSSWEQMTRLVEDSSTILLTLPQDYSVDSLSSVLAFSLYLQKINKKHDIVCGDIAFPEHLTFLSGINKIRTDLQTSNRFLIKLNVSDVKVKEFSYDVKDNYLNIFITPEEGSFKNNDIITEPLECKYDVIITFDARDLNSLGKVFTDHSQFFYSVPIVNIDHTAENEYYGQVNLIDIASSSVSEMLYNYIVEQNPKFLDQEMSTLLLTGIISKTRSFKHDVVTPKCLQIAADLLTHGAQKEVIIKNLYQRKSLDVLKTWGKLLSRLKHDESKKVFSSLLYKDDLSNIRIKTSDIIDVIHELLVSIPQAEIIVLSYWKSDNSARHIVWANRFNDALLLTKSLSSRGTKDLAYVDMDADDIEKSQKIVLDTITKVLSN